MIGGQRRSLAVAIVVAKLVVSAPVLGAEPEPEREEAPQASQEAAAETEAQQEARSRFKRALELADDGQLDAALVELNRAYELSPSYRLLYNVGVVHQQLKDYTRALEAFERYLSEGGSEVPAERLTDVKSRVERLRDRVAFLDVRASEEGVEVSIDDRPVGRTPLPPVRVNTGQRKITVTLAGRSPQSRVIELAGGETRRVSFDLEVATAAPRVVVQSHEKVSIAPLVSWGATLVLAGGALGTGVVALGKSREYDAVTQKYRVTAEELQSARSDVKTFAILTDVFLGAAIVAAGVSTYLTFSSKKKSAAASSSVRVGFGVGTAALSGSF
ncbi:MAG: PEGA domain-containing protein [Labilithrix sp.]|nr:PEGA domain-containing protein [Labilithrix sp.]MCW5809945.1 PEGA domain-containing protein [Labilithrix sp.]